MENPLPIGWAEAVVGDYLYLKNGFAFKSGSYISASASSSPVIRISDLDGQCATDECSVHVQSGEPGFEIESGDLLIAMSGATTGKIGIYEGNTPAYQNQRVGNLKLYSEALGHNGYKNYLVKNLSDQILKVAYGGAQPNISGKAIEGMEIILPPLAEQKVIAEKLDTLLAQVDTTKARLERIPDIIKRFRQSVLAAAVSGKLTNSDTGSWAKHTVDDLVKVVNGKAFPSKDYQDSGIRLLRPGNLHMSGNVIWNAKNTTFIPDEWERKRPELILKEGALLMNLTAQSLADEFLGRVCIFSEQREITLLNQRICSFESKVNYDIKPYLFLVFKSPQFRVFVDELDSGTLIKHLNVRDIKNYAILLPSETEQSHIVHRVEELFTYADTIEQKAAAALERVNNLTQSILAKAFRGELTADWRAANPELISGDNSAEALLAKIQAEREALKPVKKTRKKKAKA